MVLMIVGLWEISRFVQVIQVINTAAREGGRQAASGKKVAYINQENVQYPTSIEREIRQYIARALDPNNINPNLLSNLTVKVDNLTNPAQNDPTRATRLDRLKISATLPVDNVRLVNITFKLIPSGLITATSDWNSLRELPVTITTNTPVEWANLDD